MAIRFVRLGTSRSKQEGPRIGAVRRPPRGVPKSEYASQDWFDVWLPNIAPSTDLIKLARVAQTDKEWAVFVRKYRSEIADRAPSSLLDLLALLSHSTDFSLGCYCENQARCHRSALRDLLAERDAKLA